MSWRTLVLVVLLALAVRWATSVFVEFLLALP